MTVSAANLIGACVAVPLMAVCPRRALLTGGLAAMGALLAFCAWLERDAASREGMAGQLAAALSLWCLVYEIGPGSGYFVIVGDIASGPMSAAVYACGNMARFACEFALSFGFLSACSVLGVVTVLSFHAVVAALICVILWVALRETNPLHAPPYSAVTDDSHAVASPGRRRLL